MQPILPLPLSLYQLKMHISMQISPGAYLSLMKSARIFRQNVVMCAKLLIL